MGCSNLVLRMKGTQKHENFMFHWVQGPWNTLSTHKNAVNKKSVLWEFRLGVGILTCDNTFLFIPALWWPPLQICSGWVVKGKSIFSCSQVLCCFFLVCEKKNKFLINFYYNIWMIGLLEVLLLCGHLSSRQRNNAHLNSHISFWRASYAF